MDQPITPTELRAVFNDTPGLRFLGFSFERALATPTVRWALTRRALARRLPSGPTQPSLI